jgi:hypothetical protein
MRYVRAVFVATAAIGLLVLAAPASAEVIMTPDGHYYRLVPVKGPLPGTGLEAVTAIPSQATANVAPPSSCRLVNFENGEYQPQYVTMCGPQ